MELKAKPGIQGRAICWLVTWFITTGAALLAGFGGAATAGLMLPLGLISAAVLIYMFYKSIWKNQLPLLLYSDSIKSKGTLKAYPGVGARLVAWIIKWIALIVLSVAIAFASAAAIASLGAVPPIDIAVIFGYMASAVWIGYFDVYKMILKNDLPLPFYHRRTK